jgi:hypothetical protein
MFERGGSKDYCLAHTGADEFYERLRRHDEARTINCCKERPCRNELRLACFSP